MVNINNIVNSLWISPVIGDLQILCIQSFLDKGITFQLYSYNEIKNAPLGVVLKDANEIIAQEKVFKDLEDSYATFSDWFRVKLLNEIGGWWVDCDTFCIKRFDIDAPYVFATEGFLNDNSRHSRVCNAVLKLPPHSAFGEKVLTQISKKLDAGKFQEISWTEIGAQMLVEQIVNEKLHRYVVPTEYFCPNDFTNFKQLKTLYKVLSSIRLKRLH
jgi:mannosyltransferase OCH1-like enzyme